MLVYSLGLTFISPKWLVSPHPLPHRMIGWFFRSELDIIVEVDCQCSVQELLVFFFSSSKHVIWELDLALCTLITFERNQIILPLSFIYLFGNMILSKKVVTITNSLQICVNFLIQLVRACPIMVNYNLRV